MKSFDERRESVQDFTTNKSMAASTGEEARARLAVSHKVTHTHSSSASPLAGETRDGKSHKLSGEIGQAK